LFHGLTAILKQTLRTKFYMPKSSIFDHPSYGWAMVGIAFTLSAISFGVLASVGVFLKPLAAEFGWSRGSLSFGYSAITLATAFSGILWSIIADRYGTKWLVLFGSIVLGIPLLLLSRMESLTEFYLGLTQITRFWCYHGTYA
jgi:sugar phosphate permease